MSRILTLILLLISSRVYADDEWVRFIAPGGSGSSFTGGTITSSILGPAADNCTAPPYSFTSDATTGLCTSAAGTLQMRTAGTNLFTVGPTNATLASGQLLLPAGTVALPSMSFAGDPNTGFYSYADGNVMLTANGAAQWLFGTAALAPASTGTKSLGGTGARVAAGYFGGQTLTTTVTPLWNGAVTWNDSGTTHQGILLDVTDTASSSSSTLIDLRVGGASKMSLSKTGALTLGSTFTSGGSIITAFGSGVYARSGSSAGAVLTGVADGVGRLSNYGVTDFTRLNFGGDTSSFPALARNGANLELQFADGTSGGQLLLPAGSAALPSNSFSTDPDTGVYSYGANILGFTTGGLARWFMSGSGFAPETTGVQILGSGSKRISAGYFGGQTLTSVQPIIDGAVTWNDAGDSMRGVSLAFTETGSSSTSRYFEILGGAAGTTDEFYVLKGGALYANSVDALTGRVSSRHDTGAPKIVASFGSAGTGYFNVWNGQVTDSGTASFAEIAHGDLFFGSSTQYGIQWEGTLNAYETRLIAADTTSSDKTITLPDLTGTVALMGAANTGGLTTDTLAVTTSASPASGAACTAGTITWDASYIYVCTASGAWKRAALTGGY